VFEGNKGFMESIAGKFEIDWSKEGLDKVLQTALKKYNAEVHSQSAVDAILELRAEHGLGPGGGAKKRIAAIEIDTFDVAYNIIGGGEEGAKTAVRTKEEADHSLPWLLAVALLDGDVTPAQYAQERIVREDVQSLLLRVRIRSDWELSARFPQEHACRLRVMLRDGRTFVREKRDYEGFRTRPMTWERAAEKFERLGAQAADAELRRAVAAAVGRLEDIPITELTSLVEKVKP